MARTKRMQTMAALALAVGLAAPAGAGEIYSWRTDDGGYAFADDLRRVPERYRDRVEVKQSRSLRDHERFTPTDSAATNAYAKDLAKHLEFLRARQVAMDRAEQEARAAGAGQGISVRVTTNGEPIVDIPESAMGDMEPVIIEDVRMKPSGSIVTRNNQVIRQGDRVLAIVRSQPDYQTDGFFADESSIEGGEYTPND